MKQLKHLKKRPLSKEYAVVYNDATSMFLRRDTVAEEAVHIAIGITVDGSKEILGYEIAPNESAEVWKSLLNNLKQRGLERISLICTDELNGMENAINETYPQANIQRCLVHISRNISAKVRVKVRREILQDFKEVYRAKTKELALDELEVFIDKWKKRYPQLITILEGNPYMFTFFDYPQEVRKIFIQ